MALKVPRISENRVRQQPISGVRVSTSVDPASVGVDTEGVGQAVQGLTGTLFDIALKERQRADDALFLEGSGKIAQGEIDLTANRQTVKGEASFELPKIEKESRELLHEKVFKEAKNDRVRDRLKAVAQRYTLSGENQLNNYIGVERENFIESSKKFAVENNAKFAINTMDLKEIGNAIAKNEVILRTVGKGQGKSPEEIDSEVFDQTSNTHIEVVNQLIDSGLYEDAKIYFDETESEVDKEIFNRSDFNSKIDKKRKEIKKNEKAFHDENMKNAVIKYAKNELTLIEGQDSALSLLETGRIDDTQFLKLKSLLSKGEDVPFKKNQETYNEIKQMIYSKEKKEKIQNKINKDIGVSLSKENAEELLDETFREEKSFNQSIKKNAVLKIKSFANKEILKDLPFEIAPAVLKGKAQEIEFEFNKQVLKENALGDRIYEIADEVIDNYLVSIDPNYKPKQKDNKKVKVLNAGQTVINPSTGEVKQLSKDGIWVTISSNQSNQSNSNSQ